VDRRDSDRHGLDPGYCRGSGDHTGADPRLTGGAAQNPCK
jgi:hypothetical protein